MLLLHNILLACHLKIKWKSLKETDFTISPSMLHNTMPSSDNTPKVSSEQFYIADYTGKF